ncbi:FAD-dependent tricarballylate dehydrogenase TcuA [uncultured Thiohalocapsa sp.]|uniref:FAD-dependent tricarballylate dehydrogenase TcuA n=1 Tax=uncultured Thiohalocapsa sp. TaxID=768990 RepID=UPI0025EF7120|nr:FAD-dependent tricarballylate dehydrogenase TcuA [uncultured Thiohalocapsa sp.]
MPSPTRIPDVLVIGGGAAALAAAIDAAAAGASVRLLDAAPPALLGGNTRHSRNFRCSHDAPTPWTPDAYPPAQFRADVLRATGGGADPVLLEALVQQSRALPDWLLAQGVALQRPAQGPLPYSRRTAFFLGGGMAAVRALADRALALGVDMVPGCAAHALVLRGRRMTAVVTDQGSMSAGACVLACGGAHADPAWLARHWGAAARGFVNRGTPHVRGELLQWLLAQGAAAAGDPAGLYLVAVDARSPAHDGGIVTRIRGMPLGVVVDRQGRRRHDEGADTASTRYSRWGQRLAAYPEQTGWLVLDDPGLRAAPAALYPPLRAPDIASLAVLCGIDPAGLEATFTAYNAAVRAPAQSDAAAGWRTACLDPPKSAYARPILEPPFAAYPMRPGVTFAHHGIAVDACTRVRWTDGTVLENAFAAGMLMAANLIPQGYVSGLAVSISLVFGRIAGRAAVQAAGRPAAPLPEPDQGHFERAEPDPAGPVT